MRKNIKNKWADQFTQLPNQSNFHELIRTLCRQDTFLKGIHCYQEVPVIDLIPDYPSSQHRFDWYLEELNIVLEVHGAQHYKPTSFGAQSFEKKQAAFKDGQNRDNMKQAAAIEAGFKYLCISYKDIGKLDITYFKNLLFKRET